MARSRTRDPDWMRLALWVAKPHEWREDREDIRQEALIGAWRSVEKTRGRGRCSENRAAVKGARWAVSEYLRRAPGGSRCLALSTVSLEELREEEEREREPAAPDFTAGLIARLDCWERARRCLAADEYDVVRRLYVLQQSAVEIARERGCSKQTVWRDHRLARQKLKEMMTDEAS